MPKTSPEYEAVTTFDEQAVWSPCETYVRGDLNVVAAAVTEFLKSPPHSLTSLTLRRTAEDATEEDDDA